MWVTGRSGHWLLPCRANGLGLDRAGRYLYPFFPPASNPARAAMTKRSAFGALPSGSRRCLHPGPTPGQGHPKILPNNREASSGPSPDREPPGRVRDGSPAGGACRGKRGAITTLNDPRSEEPGVSRTGDFGFLRDVVLFEPCQLDFIGSHISQCRVKPDLVIP